MISYSMLMKICPIVLITTLISASPRNAIGNSEIVFDNSYGPQTFVGEVDGYDDDYTYADDGDDYSDGASVMPAQIPLKRTTSHRRGSKESLRSKSNINLNDKRPPLRRAPSSSTSAISAVHPKKLREVEFNNLYSNMINTKTIPIQVITPHQKGWPSNINSYDFAYSDCKMFGNIRICNARNKNTGVMCHLKMANLKNEAVVKLLLNELYIFGRLNSAIDQPSERIIKLYNALIFNEMERFTEKAYFVLVLEFLHGYNLNCNKNFPYQARLTEGHVREIIREALEGLSVLHSNKIVHRNLTPSSIFVQLKRDKKGVMYERVVIHDFSLARILEGRRIRERAGHLHYRAPETCFGKKQGLDVDFYALGLIVNVLIVGELPFDKVKFTKEYNKIQSKNQGDQTFQMMEFYRHHFAANINFDKLVSMNTVTSLVKDFIMDLVRDKKSRLGHKSFNEVESHRWLDDDSFKLELKVLRQFHEQERLRNELESGQRMVRGDSNRSNRTDTKGTRRPSVEEGRRSSTGERRKPSLKDGRRPTLEGGRKPSTREHGPHKREHSTNGRNGSGLPRRNSGLDLQGNFVEANTKNHHNGGGQKGANRRRLSYA